MAVSYLLKLMFVEKTSNSEELIQWKDSDGVHFIEGDFIWSFYEDKNDKVWWLGLAHGIGYVDEQQKTLKYSKDYGSFEMFV